MNSKSLFLLLLILVIFSCNSDNDNCTDRIIATTSLENEYECNNTRYNLELDLVDDFIIIRDHQGYDNLVTGDCQPFIDFSTYDLVIGKQM